MHTGQLTCNTSAHAKLISKHEKTAPMLNCKTCGSLDHWPIPQAPCHLSLLHSMVCNPRSKGYNLLQQFPLLVAALPTAGVCLPYLSAAWNVCLKFSSWGWKNLVSKTCKRQPKQPQAVGFLGDPVEQMQTHLAYFHNMVQHATRANVKGFYC